MSVSKITNSNTYSFIEQVVIVVQIWIQFLHEHLAVAMLEILNGFPSH